MEVISFLFKYTIFFVVFWVVAIFLTERKIQFFGLFLLVSSIIIFWRYQREGTSHLPPIAFLLFLSGASILIYNYKTDKDDYVKPGFKDYFDILFKSNKTKNTEDSKPDERRPKKKL